jgi:hypothetical protein
MHPAVHRVNSIISRERVRGDAKLFEDLLGCVRNNRWLDVDLHGWTPPSVECIVVGLVNDSHPSGQRIAVHRVVGYSLRWTVGQAWVRNAVCCPQHDMSYRSSPASRL